jgi:hypothetical protein
MRRQALFAVLLLCASEAFAHGSHHHHHRALAASNVDRTPSSNGNSQFALGRRCGTQGGQEGGGMEARKKMSTGNCA